MLRVWSDGDKAGVLDHLSKRGSTFAYDPVSAPERAVSLTMPVRIQSWDDEFHLLPIFQMNLPEGALRERLMRQFAKATGTFDDLDLLGIVGRTQIGRLRYSGLQEDLTEDVPFQSIDEILKARRDGELFTYLIDQYAPHSGLSGVQPKVLIRASSAKVSDPKLRRSPSIQSATHIVKMWDEREYPELAANEYFCLRLAKSIGLDVPHFQLSEDGGALIIERFDVSDETYLGFEDFCVLNGLGTQEKYQGGYETRLFKRLSQFLDPADTHTALNRLFRLFALNVAIRNGDAHLKNFGLTYTDVLGKASLSPVYDLVTTWAYVPRDPMALTLNGTTRWPDRKALTQLARTRCGLSLKETEAVFEQIADESAGLAPKVRRYFRTRAPEVGDLILAAWQAGVDESLGLVGRVKDVPRALERAKRPPSSDDRLISYLKRSGGTVKQTVAAIAKELGIASSTASAAIKRQTTAGRIRRSGREFELVCHKAR